MYVLLTTINQSINIHIYGMYVLCTAIVCMPYVFYLIQMWMVTREEIGFQERKGGGVPSRIERVHTHTPTECSIIFRLL